MTQKACAANLRTGLKLIRDGRKWLSAAAHGIDDKEAVKRIQNAVNRTSDVLDQLAGLPEFLESLDEA